MSGARLVTLRSGRGAPLFVIPGGGGRGADLAGVAAAMAPGRPVIAIEPTAATVEAMAGQIAAAIRRRQPAGPRRLLGYSFGGLVAIETARRLREAGEPVEFLGLIDTIYDRRFWPAPLFLTAMARRTAVHLARLARGSPTQALPELVARARTLAIRIAARGRRSAPPADTPATVGWAAAMAAWRPRRVHEPIVFFGSAQDADFGCDPVDMWRPWAGDLEVRRVDAGHLELVRNPRAQTALAAEIDAALAAAEQPRPPRVLIATRFNWIATARLALGLMEAGFSISAACPRRHVLWRLGFLAGLHRLGVFGVQRDLARAVADARPDLILPCDDRTAQALHTLYRRADPETSEGAALRDRLARALGPPETYDWLYSRAGLMAAADEEGLRHPATARVRSLMDIEAWQAAHPGPAILKTDGSWGGREVAFLTRPEELGPAFRRLSRPPGLLRALKRLLAEGDATPLHACLGGRPPALSIQAAVSGAPGNAAVACLNGEVLAAVYAEVVRSDGRAGPATVIRVVEHAEMAHAVGVLVRRMGLSGLVGFDFILDHETGAAHLIELNPRATPTAHLIGANGDDLLAALASGLRRGVSPARVRPIYAEGLVALFPQELRRDPVSAYLKGAHHDVPWQSPDLIELALAQARPWRRGRDALAAGLA